MDINATLIAQAIVFTTFVAICWKYIYPPMLSMMHEREQRIAEGLEAAKKADDSLEEAKLMYDKELSKATTTGISAPPIRTTRRAPKRRATIAKYVKDALSKI